MAHQNQSGLRKQPKPRSELEYVILALTALHPKVSGYELHAVIRDSTSYMLSAAFSQIYPALRKLTQAGLIEYDEEPIANRPAKKLYSLTAPGRAELSSWLVSDVDAVSDFRAFRLRMAFAPLMTRSEVLGLVNAAIAQLDEAMASERHAHDEVSFAFLDETAVDMRKVEATWEALGNYFHAELQHRRDWLAAWCAELEATFPNTHKLPKSAFSPRSVTGV